MATKSAGRVSIRVLPDSTRFKRDLETSLRRIEQQMKAKIETELYISRESLAKLKRQIESLVVKIKPDIELNISPEDIAALKEKIESMRPTIAVDLNTVEASRRIAALSRTRRINLIPVILGSRTVNNFVAKMKGLAGLNILGDSFREGIVFFQNIDRHAVRLGTMFTQMGALSAMAGTTAANLIVMTSQLASMMNISILAPAFLTGLGISLGILVAAFKDMKTVLADLGPRLSAFQDSISKDFWREAADPIRDMTNYLLDVIHTSEGATNTARSLGQFFGEMANSIKDLLTADKLNTMFDRMNRSIDILKGAIRPLTNSFINLGLHGSKYFERFSVWIVKLSNQFDAFIEKSAINGDLDRWTENAIQGFKDLGSVLRGTTRVFASLNRAAVAAGIGNMGDFGDALNRAADIMNQPRFQTTMTRLFSGMSAAVDGVLRGVAKLGPAIETASPTLFRVFSIIGDIASRVGGMLAEIISNPVFLGGFERLFAGISAALYNLEPAMKPFADSLGGALTLMGEVLKSVSKVGNAFAVELMPELDKIGEEFAKLIVPFETSLKNIITVLKPLIQQLNTDVVKPLVALIKDEILPLFDKIVVFAGPSVKAVLDELKILIKDDLTPLFASLNGEMDKSVGKAQATADAIAAIMKSIPVLANPTESPQGTWGSARGGWLLPGGAERFKADMDDFWRPIIAWWEEECRQFERDVTYAWQNLENWINNDFAPAVKKGIADAWDTILSHFGFGSKGEENIRKQGEEWDKFWAGVKTNIEEGYAKFKTWVQTELSKLNPIEEILEALFGPSARNTAGTGGGGPGGRGMSPGAKIGPRIFDEPSEHSWFTTFFAGVNTLVAGLGAGILIAIESWKPGVTESWRVFWEGFTANPTGSLGTIATTTALTLATLSAKIGQFILENAPRWAAFWITAQTEANTNTASTAVTVTTNLVTMGVAIAGFIATNAPIWATHFETMKTNVVNSMTDSNLTLGEKIGAMGISIAAFFAQTRSIWGPGWNLLAATVTTIWSIIKGRTETGVTESASEAGKLPSRSKSAIGNTDFTLWSSGYSLVKGFASGMDRGLNLVQTAAVNIAAMVAKYMPHSPAEMGPLSGKGYTTHSGRALVKDFAGGMMDNMSKVRKATAAVAGAANLASSMDLNNDLGDNGVTVDRRQVVVHNYNPVAEPTSRTIEKTANALRMATGI